MFGHNLENPSLELGKRKYGLFYCLSKSFDRCGKQVIECIHHENLVFLKAEWPVLCKQIVKDIWVKSLKFFLSRKLIENSILLWNIKNALLCEL